MQNLAWKTEASLRLLIWMPGLFCKIRQGQRIYLVVFSSKGSGALCSGVGHMDKGLQGCSL